MDKHTELKVLSKTLLAGITAILLAVFITLCIENLRAENTIPDTTVESTTAPTMVTNAAVNTVPESTTQFDATTDIERKTAKLNTEYLPSAYNVPLEPELQTFIIYECARNGVDPALAMAVIKVESDFNPNCVYEGNYGLMQINRCNFETYGLNDPLDPYANVKVGIKILGDLLKKYEWNDALMAYNMGEAGAAKLWRQNTHDTKYTLKVNREFVSIREGQIW